MTLIYDILDCKVFTIPANGLFLFFPLMPWWHAARLEVIICIFWLYVKSALTRNTKITKGMATPTTVPPLMDI